MGKDPLSNTTAMLTAMFASSPHVDTSECICKFCTNDITVTASREISSFTLHSSTRAA